MSEDFQITNKSVALEQELNNNEQLLVEAKAIDFQLNHRQRLIFRKSCAFS